MQHNDDLAPTAAESPRYRLVVLAMLVLVYTFNFIDRQIVGILAVPIKAELGLSDTQLGLMGGLAFALFYTLLGIPIAMLADRSNRTRIITVALVLWSAMTAVCGLAQNFVQLFLARLGVGVGEAGGVAPSYSLVADYFPPHQRARALAVYSFGVPIGSALGILFGGFIASKVDWRAAFIVVGLAGVFIAPIFWLPSFLVRSYGLTLLDASLFFGAILFFGGIAGIWLGGFLADRFGAARRRYYAMIPAFAFLATVPFYVAAVMSSSLVASFFLFLVPTALGLAWLGPVLSSIQHIVPLNMRSTASAIFLFVNNLIGIGLGTVMLGLISDALSSRYGEDSLRYAILTGSVFYLVAAALFLLSARRLERDWEK